MARKKTEQVLTPEEKRKKEINHQMMMRDNSDNNINEPTRYFKIGEEVAYASFKECIVEEILNDGKLYILRVVGTDTNYGRPYDYTTWRVADWHNIFPIGKATDTNFLKNDDLRIDFNNSSVESLLHLYYRCGIDMQPDYQRGYVWNEEDNVNLIDSIFNSADIGKFVIVQLEYTEYQERGKDYEILDGKQRLTALVKFYEDRFRYRGKYFSELSGRDKNAFRSHRVSLATLKNYSKEQVLKTFLLLNRSGKVMDKEHLNRVEDMIKDEFGIEV